MEPIRWMRRGCSTNGVAYREFSMGEKSAVLISGILGLNDGYVSDGHNGANFYALSVGLERNITDDFVISCHGMQSLPLIVILPLMGMSS